jgi:hypothetical protein
LSGLPTGRKLLEQVNAAVRKHVDYLKPTIVKAGCFSRSAKPKAMAP